MTDIIERLRTSASSDEFLWRADLQGEAADTIEHLRSMVENLMSVGGLARISPPQSFADRDSFILIE